MHALLEVVASKEARQNGAHFAVPANVLVLHQLDNGMETRPIALAVLPGGLHHDVKIPFRLTDDPEEIARWVAPPGVQI